MELKRSVSLFLLTLYGLGTIIGAGIYVLIGEVVGRAGTYAPLSFFLAAIIASLTALSYAELSSRHPRSAGEAAYVDEAFAARWFSQLIGWSVVTVGVVSSATIVSGFIGYLDWFIKLPGWFVITSLVVLLSAVAIWGITQSLWVAGVATILELLGLFLVIGTNADTFAQLPERWPALLLATDSMAWTGVFLAAFLAFYAFIGFEDMVNIAEEVTEVRRTLPRAIVLALIISTLLYLLISVVAVLALPAGELSRSSAPLSTLVAGKSAALGQIISIISLIAVVNGALAQIIMASRVIYGMSAQGLAPGLLASILPRTQTPALATVLIGLTVLILALSVPLLRLAEITSFITLFIFAAMHVALLRLKRLEPEPAGAMLFPRWIPVAGFASAILLAGFQFLRPLL